MTWCVFIFAPKGGAVSIDEGMGTFMDCTFTLNAAVSRCSSLRDLQTPDDGVYICGFLSVVCFWKLVRSLAYVTDCVEDQRKIGLTAACMFVTLFLLRVCIFCRE